MPLQQLQEAYSQLETTNRALMEANAQLSELSTTDALTSLPNRRAVLHHIDAALARSRRTSTSMAPTESEGLRTARQVRPPSVVL